MITVKVELECGVMSKKGSGTVADVHLENLIQVTNTILNLH